MIRCVLESGVVGGGLVGGWSVGENKGERGMGRAVSNRRRNR